MTHSFVTKNRDTGSANPETVSITPGAGATVLVLGIVTEGISQRTGGTPTFDGNNLTHIGSQIQLETNVELWYLIDPSAGINNVSVPNTSSNVLYLVASVYKASAGNATEYDTFNSANNTSANPSIALTTGGDGCAIVQVLGDGYVSIPSSNNKTLLYSVDNGSYSDNHQYELQAVAGETTFTWTCGSSNWCTVIGSFKEVSAGPTGHPWYYERKQ